MHNVSVNGRLNKQQKISDSGGRKLSNKQLQLSDSGRRNKQLQLSNKDVWQTQLLKLKGHLRVSASANGVGR